VIRGSGENSSPSKTSEKETFQAKEVRELVKSSGVRGEIMVSELLIPTLTETLPELSRGTVSTILGENWETGREYEQHYGPTPVSCHSTFVGGICYSGFFDSHPYARANYSPAGIFFPDISD